MMFKHQPGEVWLEETSNTDRKINKRTKYDEVQILIIQT